MAPGPQLYRVLIGGISRPGMGAAFRGEVIDGATLGGADRVARLLANGSIEAV